MWFDNRHTQELIRETCKAWKVFGNKKNKIK